MSEDLVKRDFAPAPARANASGADSREALIAWLSQPHQRIEDAIRELSAEHLTQLLEEIGYVLRRQEAKFACMQEIGSALGQTIQLDELLHLIMEKITRLMEAERSTLFLVDAATGELWSKIAQGGVDTEIRLGAGQGLAGWVATTGKSINVRDAYNDPRFNPEVDAQTGFTTRNMLCQPVRNQEGHIIGVVQVLNRRSGDFSVQDENLLSAIASQTAVAIENSKLYLSVVDKNIELRRTQRELEKRVRELDLLYEVERELSRALDLDDLIETITQKTLDLISARASALTLREEGQNHMFVLVDRSCDGEHNWEFSTSVVPSDHGIAGKVMASGEALLCNMDGCGQVDDAASDEIGLPVQNVISVPLFDDEQCIGALEVINRRRLDEDDGDPRGFTEADRKILTLIAAQIAGAVASRRHREEQEKAERLATIGQMLTGVVHDLKNPIAVISGNVQLMARADDRDKREEYATSIKKQFKHLNQMTRELLTFARGDTEISTRAGRSGRVLRRGRRTVAPRAVRHRHRFSHAAGLRRRGSLRRRQDEARHRQPGQKRRRGHARRRCLRDERRSGRRHPPTGLRLPGHRRGHPRANPKYAIRLVRHPRQEARHRPGPGDRQKDHRRARRHDHLRHRDGRGHDVLPAVAAGGVIESLSDRVIE